MITKEQLRDIAKKTGIGIFYQEKDYFLNIFLRSLYQKNKNVIFKGGTCLKLAYNYTRFSEDLDFNSKLKPESLQKLFQEVLKDFLLLGIEYEIIKQEKFGQTFTMKIKFRGPLYTGRKETENAIMVDIGFRGGTLLKPLWKQITSPYPDIPNYFVIAMQEREILAEKIRSLIMRGKARDMFDLWCMLNNNVEIDKNLINKKLKQAGIEQKEIRFCSKKEYENDLANLLSTLPDYEQVIKEIKIKFKNFISSA